MSSPMIWGSQRTSLEQRQLAPRPASVAECWTSQAIESRIEGHVSSSKHFCHNQEGIVLRVRRGMGITARKHWVMVLALTTGLLFSCGEWAGAADWPNFRGQNRDGKSLDTGLLQEWPDGGPQLLWAKEDLGHGYSSVVAVGDTLYTTGRENTTGYVYSLDLNGALKWKAPYGPCWSGSVPGTRNTPTVYRGMLYVMSAYGRVVCLDAANGNQVWAVDTAKAFGARNIRWGLVESLLVQDEKIICTPGGAEVGVAALDRQTGKTLWSCKGIGDKSAYCSPFLLKTKSRAIVVTLMAKSLVGTDWETGELLWKEPHTVEHDIHAVSPVYEDGRLYITAGWDGDRGVMFDLSPSGKQITRKWTDSKLDCQLGGVIVHEGYIYGASDRNSGRKWVCMNLRTGDLVREIPGVGKGSIAYADGMFYGYGEKGDVGLIKASPDDFRMISSFKITKGSKQHWAHPTIANGRLYIRHGNALMAYDILDRARGGDTP